MGITRKTVGREAWAAGFRGVAGLARSIGVSRAAIYSAVSRPHSYKPTARKIRERLGKEIAHAN